MAHHAKVWAVAPVDGVDALTAAEAIALDNGQFTAVDGDAGGTWAPAAAIIIGGAGLQFNKALFGTRLLAANYTLDASGADFICAFDTTTATPTYVLTLTAAVANRVVIVKHYLGTPPLLVTPNGTNTIDGINASLTLGQIGSGVILVGISATAWIVIGKV